MSQPTRESLAQIRNQVFTNWAVFVTKLISPNLFYLSSILSPASFLKVMMSHVRGPPKLRGCLKYFLAHGDSILFPLVSRQTMEKFGGNSSKLRQNSLL
jgi:hypothetical protein